MKADKWALLACALFVVLFRSTHIHKNEIAWDVLGYYLPLASSVVHDQPLIKDYQWLKDLNARENLTGTYYQISTNETGEPMYFFFFGWSELYAPFFATAHVLAEPMGFPADGFSPPYQYALVIGSMLYALIGLWFFRKVLRWFYSENITALVMLITVFATNYAHHIGSDSLGSVNVLFMFVSIVLWHTIQWYETGKGRHFIALCIAMMMMALIKPSEVFVCLIPLLFKGKQAQTWKEKWQLFISNKWALGIGIIAALILLAPQIAYWYAMTGRIFYDSYKNPGVGLDFFSPHISDVLFSYRKGWFVYTPIMLFGCIGFYYLYKHNRRLFIPAFSYFIIAFWVVASWTEWWYGAAFSTRPMITVYPVIGLAFGALLTQASTWTHWKKYGMATCMVLMAALNQFQWWQMRAYIWDPYRTTKDYYWAIFLQTENKPEYEQYLAVKRSFSGAQEFDSTKYYLHQQFDESFDAPTQDKNDSLASWNGQGILQVKPKSEFALTRKWKYKSLSEADHVWIELDMEIIPDSGVQWVQPPLLVTCMDHKKPYGYVTHTIPLDSLGGAPFRFKVMYLTPELRSRKDEFQSYIWNRDGVPFKVGDYHVKVYEAYYKPWQSWF